MSRSKIGTVIIAVLAVAGVAFVVMLFVIKLLWAWTIPDLFPGAVEQGLVAGEVSWFTAVKIAIFVAVLSGIAGGHSSHRRESPRPTATAHAHAPKGLPPPDGGGNPT